MKFTSALPIAVAVIAAKADNLPASDRVTRYASKYGDKLVSSSASEPQEVVVVTSSKVITVTGDSHVAPSSVRGPYGSSAATTSPSIYVPLYGPASSSGPSSSLADPVAPSISVAYWAAPSSSTPIAPILSSSSAWPSSYANLYRRDYQKSSASSAAPGYATSSAAKPKWNESLSYSSKSSKHATQNGYPSETPKAYPTNSVPLDFAYSAPAPSSEYKSSSSGEYKMGTLVSPTPSPSHEAKYVEVYRRSAGYYSPGNSSSLATSYTKADPVLPSSSAVASSAHSNASYASLVSTSTPSAYVATHMSSASAVASAAHSNASYASLVSTSTPSAYVATHVSSASAVASAAHSNASYASLVSTSTPSAYVATHVSSASAVASAAHSNASYASLVSTSTPSAYVATHMSSASAVASAAHSNASYASLVSTSTPAAYVATHVSSASVQVSPISQSSSASWSYSPSRSIHSGVYGSSSAVVSPPLSSSFSTYPTGSSSAHPTSGFSAYPTGGYTAPKYQGGSEADASLRKSRREVANSPWGRMFN